MEGNGVSAESKVEKQSSNEIYVTVNDPNDNEPVEIPTEADGTLSLNTLEHTFPGAYGLSFKNPATGAKRAVSVDESGKCFLPPAGGWDGKVCTIIFRPAPSQIADKEVKAKDVVERKRVHESNGKDGKVGGESQESDGEVKGESDRNSKRARRDHAASSEKACSDMIVMGVPYEIEEEALKEYFEQFGTVELSEIKRSRDGSSRGFGFIRMGNYEDQVRILSTANHNIGGRECQVRLSNTDKTLDPLTTNNLAANPRIYVGGLDEHIGRERLSEFFSEHLRRLDKSGAESIRDLYYPKPFRNFAFITLSSAYAARELVRQRDFVIDGYPCEVTAAGPKRGVRYPNQQQPQPDYRPSAPNPHDPRWNYGGPQYASNDFDAIYDGGRGGGGPSRRPYYPVDAQEPHFNPSVRDFGPGPGPYEQRHRMPQQYSSTQVWSTGALPGHHQQMMRGGDRGAEDLLNQLPPGPVNNALREMFSKMSKEQGQQPADMGEYATRNSPAMGGHHS